SISTIFTFITFFILLPIMRCSTAFSTYHTHFITLLFEMFLTILIASKMCCKTEYIHNFLLLNTKIKIIRLFYGYSKRTMSYLSDNILQELFSHRLTLILFTDMSRLFQIKLIIVNTE